MKVLIIPEQFPVTGKETAGIFIRDYIKAISRFAEVEVFYTCAFKVGDLLPQDHNIPVHFYSYQNFRPTGLIRAPKYYFWEKAAISYAKRTISKPDVIHLHGASLRGNIAGRLAQYWKIPLVITEHTGPWSAISDRIMVLRRVKQAISRSDALLPVSHHLLEEMAQSGIQHSATFVTGNPVDTDFFIPGPELALRPANFLFLGRFDEFKGALRVAKAFQRISEFVPTWNLILAGDGEERAEILEFVEKNHLGQRVSVLPFQSREGMVDLLHRSRCLIFPSRFESFGLVGAEALSTGTPLICTNTTGPADYFNNTLGFAVDPDNIEGIAQSMLKMARELDTFHPVELRQQIVNNFGVAAFAKKLEDVYLQVQKKN